MSEKPIDVERTGSLRLTGSNIELYMLLGELNGIEINRSIKTRVKHCQSALEHFQCIWRYINVVH